jgi:hypothetical protein
VTLRNRGATKMKKFKSFLSEVKDPTKQETSWYPKKGFPKEGEYGYHPNLRQSTKFFDEFLWPKIKDEVETHYIKINN